MKWVFILAFLVQRNCISSQTVTNENVRESRQSKFEECCPCPTGDRIKDNHVLDTNIVPSDCPCRSADSETASSIFTPKAVQSFVRPHKEEPKPLLNPEVGLASSVLETLREVTDQEYEEAVARDVARSALQAIDSDAHEMPVSASTNMFNNMLSPRSSESMDVIPEASYNAETRCIHPTLNRIGEFRHFETQPQRNLLKDFLLFKPSGLPKNIFDMDNSPSNIQENILSPKNKLLDDIKIKTNLLKSKLLTNNKGLLQRMVTDKSFDNTYSKSHKKIPDWKSVAQADDLKSSRLFDPNHSPPVAEKTKDFSLFNNNISKNSAQNNKKNIISLQKPQQSNKYVTDEVLSSEAYNLPVSKEIQRSKNTKDIDSNADNSILSPAFSPPDNCNLKNENILQVETTSEKIDFPNGGLSEIPTHYNTEILDTLPSPSEITEDKNQLIDFMSNPPQENNNVPEIYIEHKPEHITQSIFDNSKPTSIDKPATVQDNTNNLSIENNSEQADKYVPEIVCVTKNSKTPEPVAINTDVFNFPVTQNEEGNIYSINAENNNGKEESIESSNNLLNKNKENKINIFPNIREGLIKTFENVKKINAKWQEKIKLDMQDALELVNVKNNVVMQKEPTQNPVFMQEILTIPHKSNAKMSNTPTNTLSSHDLQKMSNSILGLSSVSQNSDPKLSSAVKEASDTIHTMDNSGEPSEIVSCLTPAEVYNSKKSEEKPLNTNNKQITKGGSEKQQFPNLNTGMIDRDIEDNLRKSETTMEKSSLNIIEPSTVRFGENEMAGQASELKPQRHSKIDLDNSRYLKQDFVIQPNNEMDELGRSVLNVNNFFDNVKSTISNVFSKTNENISEQNEDNDDKIDNNYKLSKQDYSLDLGKPTLNLKKSAKFVKAPKAIETDTLILDKYKPNLNLYKARVAVPKTFDVKPILILDETLDKRSQTLSQPRNILPKTYSTNKFVGNENLRSLFKESANNNPNSEATILSPNIFHNNFRSASKNLGSLKYLTEEALQNFHKTLGSPLRAVTSKENNGYLNKNNGNENLFETMVNKRNEWNDKLQAINLDLNDRLSLLSHRMAESILPSLNSQPIPQRRITTKGKSVVKNKTGLDYLRRINTPSDIKSTLPKSKLRQSNDNLSMSKGLKKSLISDHLSDLKSARLYENPISQKRTLVKPENRNSKTETKTLSPNFKTISVATTIRPETLISGLKTPQTFRKVSNLTPKITAPLEKKTFVSRLKSREPYSLGSENIMSRVLLDKNKDTDKSAKDVSSNESDQKIESNFKNTKASKKEESRNLALSKLREALKAKILNRDSNKNKSKDNNKLKSSTNTDDEIIPSASENVNKEIDGSLKENVQYKCKMLCTKDK